MVQPSFLASLAIFLLTVLAIPVDVAERDVDNALEARMFRKLGKEIGYVLNPSFRVDRYTVIRKEVYTQLGNAVLHGGPTIAQPQRSVIETRGIWVAE